MRSKVFEDFIRPKPERHSHNVSPRRAIRSRSVGSLEQTSKSLSPDMEEQALRFFFENIVPDLGCYWKDLLTEGRHGSDRQRVLDSALLSVAYSFMSLAPTHSYLKPQAIIEYSKAMHSVKSLLKDPNTRQDDTLIVVLLVFGLWEVRKSMHLRNSPSIDAHADLKRHCSGAKQSPRSYQGSDWFDQSKIA